LVTLPENFWPSVLGSVVIQLYAGECTPSVDRALINFFLIFLTAVAVETRLIQFFNLFYTKDERKDEHKVFLTHGNFYNTGI